MYRWLMRWPTHLLVLLAPALIVMGIPGAQPAFAAGSNTWKIVNYGGRCLDMTNGSNQLLAPAQIWTCNTNEQQLWNINFVGSDFMIQNKKSGLCLSLLSNNTNSGAAVIQWTCKADNQFELWFNDPNFLTDVNIVNQGDADVHHFLSMHPSGCGNSNGLKIFMSLEGTCNASFWSYKPA